MFSKLWNPGITMKELTRSKSYKYDDILIDSPHILMKSTLHVVHL